LVRETSTISQSAEDPLDAPKGIDITNNPEAQELLKRLMQLARQKDAGMGGTKVGNA
jgi:hypothetical protein